MYLGFAQTHQEFTRSWGELKTGFQIFEGVVLREEQARFW